MQLRKSNHKFFWKEFEHPLDGPKGEIQRTPRGTYLIKRSRSPTMFFIQLLVGFRPLFAPRFKHFKLVNHTSLMIGTRLPRNNLDFSTSRQLQRQPGASTLFYLPPSMAVAFRAVQLAKQCF
jgi:hypothetical protein